MSAKDTTTVAEIGEFGLIRRIQTLLRERGREGGSSAGAALVLGIGDDAAIVRPEPGWEWVLTCDVQIAGRHFREEWLKPRTIGRRAMTVNLSDLAAMSAEPSYVLVSLGLPPAMTVSEVEELYEGFLEALEQTDALIVGGNLAGAGSEWFCALTLVGRVRPGQALTRGGAAAGDRILVTGYPGRSAAGLALLEHLSQDLWKKEEGLSPPPDPGREQVAARRRHFLDHLKDFLRREPWALELIEAYRRPQARLRMGQWLGEAVAGTDAEARNAGTGALIDVSDGLVGDLEHVCERSGVRAQLELDRLPADPALREASRYLRRDRHAWSLQPSDDYELLLTTREAAAERIGRELRALSLMPVTEIGSILPDEDGAGRGGETEKGGGGPLVRVLGLPPGASPPTGWDHFSPSCAG